MITELRAYPWYLAPVVWIESWTRLTVLSSLLAKHRDKTINQIRRPRSVGEIIDIDYLEPRDWEDWELAEKADIEENALLDLCLGCSNLSQEMAERLGAALGTSAEFWLNAEKEYRDYLSKERTNEPVHS